MKSESLRDHEIFELHDSYINHLIKVGSILNSKDYQGIVEQYYKKSNKKIFSSINQLQSIEQKKPLPKNTLFDNMLLFLKNVKMSTN